MKILLTGNQGYIGCVMEEMLLKNGYKVVGLDAGFFQGKTFIPIEEKVRKNRQENQIVKDIRDITEEDCTGCDAVVHLAALSNDPLGNLNPQLTEDINFKATIQLAHAAKRAGVKRFVYASSCSMYGAADNAVPLDETAQLNPQTPYAVSKVNSEAGLQKIADQNFCPVFMRNATAFGISPRMRFDLVLNNLCAWAWTTKEVVMVSDGKPWRPLVHIQDIAAACIAALEAPTSHIHNQAFNVGTTEENYTIREIAEKVVANFPKTTLKCLNKNSEDTRSYRISFEKIKKIGFMPMWTVDKGIEELKQACNEYNVTKEMFEDEYFTTVKRMMALQERDEIDKNLRWKRGEK